MRLSKWSIDYYFFSFLFFCGSICSVVSQITYVKRESDGDMFGQVRNPSKNCNDIYRANNNAQGNLECQCRSGKPTFLLSFNNSCVQDSFIEMNFGCKKNIITKGIFDLDQHSKGNFGQQIKEINGMCSVDNIHYINGDNGMLMHYGSSDVFAIDTTSKGLSWNKTMISPRGSLHGRIIRLQTKNCTFKLRNNDELENPCIFFKSKGKITFSNSTTVKLSTASPIKTDVTTLYSTSALSITSIQSVTATKTQHVTSARVSTLVKTSVATTPQPSSTPHVFVFTTTPIFIPVTSSAIPTEPSSPADNKRQNDEQPGAPVGAIVGTVAGILFIVIAIIVVFFWRRRKRENTRKSSKAGNGQNHKDNPTYGKNETIDLSKQKQVPKITGNELEYDYAAVDGDPRASNGAAPGIYQSLITDPNRESVYTPLERQEANEYNKVERAPFKPARNGPTDPTYNVLERPSDNNDDYLEPGSHIDKNKRPHSKLAPQNNEPVYNVLEGPNQEGEDEPEYNVLEDPDAQDDQEYNVLEDPDDNYDNTPVETDRGHPSSHDNVGYASTIDFKKRQGTKNEPVYEAPEGPSSELTYQPLQINGQDNVYQPLDRTSRMIPDDQPVYHVLESQGSEA